MKKIKITGAYYLDIVLLENKLMLAPYRIIKKTGW